MTKFKNLSEKFAGMTPAMKAMLLFGVEGLLFQFVMSLSGVSGFGTNLYATNLGATDSQIGMIQLVANLTAVVLMLPAGIISDRLKNAKTVPVVLMLVMGVAYFFYGTVPALGENLRMAFFFVFQFVVQMAGAIVLVLLDEGPLHQFLLTLDFQLTGVAAVHFTMVALLLLTVLYGAIFYIVTTITLKKRLNLE